MKTSLVFFSLFFLFACAPNPYRPLSSGLGFSEAKISDKQYEIMYHGTSSQDPLIARQYAIVRAAEIARREHYPYFLVENSKTRERDKIDIETDPTYSYPYGYGWGGSCYYTRTVVKPVVRITVTMDSTDCFHCLSADEQIQEARANGILLHEPPAG